MKEPTVSIFIDGEELPMFKDFTLKQSMYDHHWFELVLSHEVVEDLGSHRMDKSRSWLGKPLRALFGDNIFNGLITSVELSHAHGFNGDLIIEGFSPTILLEGGAHSCSWLDRSLKDIVAETVKEAGLRVITTPAHKSWVEYMVQYKESHFNFLKRLAGTYHEWFYYDGKDLHFGKPLRLPTVPLVYGMDVDTISSSVKVAPVNFQSYSYRSTIDYTFSGPTPGSVKGLDYMGREAMAASGDVYQIVPKMPAVPRIKDKSEFEDFLKGRQASAAAGLSRVSGTCTSQELRPGVVIELESAVRKEKSWSSKPYGKYLVISVDHRMSSNKEYINSFVGIPAGVEVLPSPAFEMPVAEAQIARVTSNSDPKGQGRVRVHFLWQGPNERSPWLRVMSPDAGKSDAVSKNRGSLFIPEVNDVVMVGFRYNDPVRPFVLGAIHNGLTGGGGDAKNRKKSISTRSGNTITFDDENGSLYIADAKDCSLTLDGKGKLRIQSGTEIRLECGDSSILMKEDGTIQIIGVNIDVVGSEKVQAASGTVPEGGNVDGSCLRLDPETVLLEGKADTVVKGGDLAGLEAAGSQVICDGNVSVSGEKVNLN